MNNAGLVIEDLNPELAEYHGVIEAHRDQLPESIYKSLLFDLECYHFESDERSHNVKEETSLREEISRNIRLMRMVTAEFWMAAEKAANKSEIDETLQSEFYDGWTQSMLIGSNTNIRLSRLWSLLAFATINDDLRNKNKAKHDLEAARKASAVYRHAISKLLKNYTPRDKLYFEDDYQMLVDDGDGSTPYMLDMENILKTQEARFDKAIPPIKTRKAPSRCTHFATQISNWFIEAEGKQRKRLAIKTAKAVLLDIDPTIEVTEHCL